MMDKFNCFSLSPIELEHPGLAIASIRAGGIGILDREFCQPENLERAISNLEQVLALKNAPGAAGLRLNLTQIEQSGQLLARLELESHWLILSGWQEATAETLREKLQLLSGENRLILLEITDANQLALLASLFPFLAGLVAKGQESGGWVGEDPAFILTQKLLKTSSLPIYVQGGIGIHTAAACRAAGAAGVVLDDQLWLMPESPLPGEWQEYLRYLNGQEAIAIGERLGRACRVLSRFCCRCQVARNGSTDRDSRRNLSFWPDLAAKSHLPNWLGKSCYSSLANGTSKRVSG
jgi:NAD(P)H-dependent flavin oxidoreductase YrpB (nitropropane dioxygenase family)